MKHLTKILLGIVVLSCLQFGLVGCLVGGRGDHRGGWGDGPWMDGGPRVGVGIDVHPAGGWR
jgi:hypothetical protein